MKNIKNLILPIILATSMLVNSTPPTAYEVGKIAGWYFLPISVLTLLNSITGKKEYTTSTQQKVQAAPFTFYKEAFKAYDLIYTGFLFVDSPVKQLQTCWTTKKFPTPDLPMTILGALATAGSIAGIWYCYKQIEAQKQPQSNPNS